MKAPDSDQRTFPAGSRAGGSCSPAAGRGIGEATARRAAREGADVLLISRTQSEFEAVAASIVDAGGMAWRHVADVAVDEQVEAAVDAARERWGGIDVLVNCAGFGFTAPFIDFPISQWRTVLDVNLTGAFMMAQRVSRVMGERRRLDRAHLVDRGPGRGRGRGRLQRLQGRHARTQQHDGAGARRAWASAPTWWPRATRRRR